MKRILIIDDDPSIRTVFQRYLERQGYVMHVAENGREGLLLMEVEPPDLVITDIMMPDTDGLEVLMSIRSKHPEIPVIAISGGMHSAPMDFLPLAKKFGARKVLYKPVELKDLLVVVKKVLGE